ncbi:aminoacyl-tRNA hydrolase [candidate division KSB1 bacterium]|nr:MAG: aminoacyl-tRNA hydrolase [candidate division KSB1 bacterium]
MSDKYMIVGLGNPGAHYQKTRHNIGFMVVDRMVSQFDTDLKKGRGNCEIAHLDITGNSAFVVKPLAFMNNSGVVVARLLKYYNIDLSRLLVIYDEVELPFGRLRIRKKGGSGGHNGINSIIDYIKTKEFARLRIGIGTEYAKKDMTKFVLSNFSRNEQQKLDQMLAKSVNAVLSFVREGVDKTMTIYNKASI